MKEGDDLHELLTHLFQRLLKEMKSAVFTKVIVRGQKKRKALRHNCEV